MTAMVNPELFYNIVDLIQGSQAWLDWRPKVITATDSFIIANESTLKTPLRLYQEKKGKVLPVDLSRNPYVNRGRVMEDVARRLAEHIMGDILLPICAVSKEHPFMAASFDGLSGKSIPTEFKATGETTYAEVEALREQSSAYKEYFYQVQHQICVAGSDKGYLGFLSPFEEKLIWFEIGRDDKLIKKMLSDNSKFYDRLLTDKPPKANPARDILIPTGLQAKIWERYATQIIEAQAVINEAEIRLVPHKSLIEHAKTSLLDIMGEFGKAEAFGVSINRFAVQGKVNYSNFIEDLKTSPDKMVKLLLNEPEFLDTYRGKGSQTVRLTTNDRLLPKNVVDASLHEEYQQVIEDKIPSLSFF